MDKFPVAAAMVFLTQALFRSFRRKQKLHSNPFLMDVPHMADRSWKRRKVFQCTAHLQGRSRNTFKCAVRKMTKWLQYETRDARKVASDLNELHRVRVEAAALELNYDSWNIREAMARTGINLSNRILANLAVWEPRTFRSIVALVAHKSMQPEERGGMGMPKCGPGTEVVDRGKI